MISKGDILEDRFQILEMMGEGDIGRVWIATDLVSRGRAVWQVWIAPRLADDQLHLPGPGEPAALRKSFVSAVQVAGDDWKVRARRE